ncbi:MAG: MBL fold metallo-hydrolase [Acidobacteriota bacterium]
MATVLLPNGNRHLSRIGGVALFLVACVAYTQTQPAAAALKVQKLKDNLYWIEGDGSNTTMRVTNEGVILVEDKHESTYPALLAAIKTVTPQPVKYIFTTHYHEDHSGGNSKFLGTAQIISTVNTRTAIVNHKAPNSRPIGPNFTPAQIAFTEEMSVFLGGAEVRGHYFGRGHTNGDAVVYFPDLKAVAMGDLMSGENPGIDYLNGGSMVELIKTYDKLLAAYDFDIVVPGHGAVTNRAGLKTYRDNIVKLMDRARTFLRQGKKTEDDLSKFMEKEYGWAIGSTRQVQNIPGMIKELQ